MTENKDLINKIEQKKILCYLFLINQINVPRDYMLNRK